MSWVYIDIQVQYCFCHIDNLLGALNTEHIMMNGWTLNNLNQNQGSEIFYSREFNRWHDRDKAKHREQAIKIKMGCNAELPLHSQLSAEITLASSAPVYTPGGGPEYPAQCSNVVFCKAFLLFWGTIMFKFMDCGSSMKMQFAKNMFISSEALHLYFFTSSDLIYIILLIIIVNIIAMWCVGKLGTAHINSSYCIILCSVWKHC